MNSDSSQLFRVAHTLYKVAFLLLMIMIGTGGSGVCALVGYWKFDEGSGTVAADSSGFGSQGTLNGNVVFVPGKFGSAVSFSGSGGYVNVGSTALGSKLALKGSSYSITWWMKPGSSVGPQQIINKDNGLNWNGGYGFSVNSNGLFGVKFNDGTNHNYNYPAASLSVWSFLAVVYDKATGIQKIYINGELTSSVNVGTIGLLDRGSDPLWFGGMPGFAQWYVGLLDEVRVYNEPISKADISRIMVAKYPEALVGYWSFNQAAGNVVPDQSGNGNDATLFGGASYVAGKLGTAVSFSGSGAYVNIKNAAKGSKLSLIDTSHTLTLWVKPSSNGAAQRVINKDNGQDYNGGYAIKINSNGLSGISFNDGSNHNYNFPNMPVATWSFLAVVYDKPSGVQKVYVDGNLVSSVNVGTSGLNDRGSDELWLGGIPNYSQWYHGALDEVRVYSEALNVDELKQLMQDGGQPSLVGHWSFDQGSGETIVDDSGNGNLGTIVGNVSYVPGKFGQALLFSGGSVNLRNSDKGRKLGLVNSSHTISWWMKPTTVSGTQRLINKDNGQNYAGGYAFVINSSGLLGVTFNDGSNHTYNSPALPLNIWSLVTAVYDVETGMHDIYVDAHLVSSTFVGYSGVHDRGTDELWLGGIPIYGQNYVGYIDDVRIYNQALTQPSIVQLKKGKGYFPVMAWNVMADVPGNKQQQLTTMKSCGFNIAGLMTLAEVSVAESAGLESFLLDQRASEYNWSSSLNYAAAQGNVSSLVANTINRESIVGYYVVDEPSGSQFPGIGTIAGLLGQMDPTRYVYCNLLPNWSLPALLGGTYQQYVDKYFNNCYSNLLMVDNYCLMGGGGGTGAEDPANFYKNMETMRRGSFQNRVPFWNIILSMPHAPYAVPTFGNMSLQVYGSLAYGARGISYFCYFTNSSPDAYLGPIDINGNKTPTWDMVAAVNSEIAALAPTLNSLTSVRCFFYGSIPSGGSAAPTDSKIVVTGTIPNLLVGEFTHEDGTPYVLLVNRNTSSPVSINFVFPRHKNISRISPQTGIAISQVGGAASLPAGGGVLFRLNP